MICRNRKCSKEIEGEYPYCPFCGWKQQVERKAYSRRPNGTGTVYRLSGSRTRPWVASKSGIVLGYYQNKKAAVDALERSQGITITDKYNYTFAQVYKAWAKETDPDRGESGKRQNARSFDIFAALHNRKFRELRTDDFQTVLDAHKDKSASTVAKYKSLVHGMSKWAVKEDIITTNYASFAKARGEKSETQIPLSDDDIKLIYNDRSDAAIVVCMLLSTGMRLGELFALPLADYHITYCVGGEKTDTGRNRIIPIRPEGRAAFAWIASAAAAKGKNKLIDGYSGNTRPENFRKRDYAPLLSRLCIDPKKTPRSTRTTYVTQSVSDGLDPATLQKVVGHADFETTQKYYNKPDAKALVAAVEKAANNKSS